jgi:hypothetical protein
MFEIHIGSTPNDLTPKDLRELGLRTEGYALHYFAHIDTD